MTLPRRSYSEQVGYSKGRQQWKRSNSHANSGNANATARPLAPISETTKNKLNQFQFQPPKTLDSVAAKTPDGPSTGGQTDDTNADPENQTSGKHARKKQAPEPNLKQEDGITTPAGRVSLRDLLASDANQNNAQDDNGHVSPSEHIMWNNKHDHKYLTSLSPMIPRNGRKRARSSSPLSSPLNEKRRTPVPAVDVKKLSEALRSPHADPTLELWDRFSLGNTTSDANTPLGASNPNLAQLMVSSSPRSGKNTLARAEGGLRRAISAGLNWPKRRRIDRPDTPGFLSKPSRELSDASKSSLVNALLDTVENNKDDDMSSLEIEGDGSTGSPSPKKKPTEVVAGPVESMSAAPSQPLAQTFSAPRTVSHTSQTVDRGGALPETASDPDGSDYGDDDLLDGDTLLHLENHMNTTLPGPPTHQPLRDLSEKNLTHDKLSAKTGDTKFDADFDDGFDDDLDDTLFEVADRIAADAENKLAGLPSTPGSRKQQHHLPAKTLVNHVDSDDDFGDDFGDNFDFDAAERAATQSIKQHDPSFPATNQKPRAIQRYLVTNVLENEFLDDRGRSKPEKIVLVQVDKSKATGTIHLRDVWYDTPAHAGSFVHVIGAFSSDGRCIIDDDHNILILHPDQLISATVVADSFTCMRRAVLQDRVKATSEASAPLVYGTMLHEIFQAALLANQWDLPYLSSVIDRILEKHVEDLYKIKVGPSIAKEHLQSKMPELSSWAEAFISSQPNPDALASDRNGKKVNMCVNKLLDVEEHIWSPMYGLKGNIDATVQVVMKDDQGTRTLTVPFEVKTGKNVNTSHIAQTALYNLLLSDRYDIEIAYGILYYMESSQTTRIPAIRQELRHMIMQRNQLACYVRERSVQLPPMKKQKHMCGKCYAKTTCFIYHKLADDGDGVSSGMDSKFDEVVKHLTPKHKEFFVKWENLLTKEEKESQKLRRELWTMISKDREKLGRCFSDVIIEDGSWSEDHSSPDINRFRYTFVKRERGTGHSFLESQLTVGEPIVISDEQGHFALALGYVTSVRKQRISVAVDRRLHNARVRQPGFDEYSNQVFAGIMEIEGEGAPSGRLNQGTKKEPMRYRLDKDEFSNGMAVVRNNLVQVMADDVFGARAIRQLVVDLVPPRFKAAPTQYEIADKASLNVDQQAAIEKVMSAEDYALVLGMPGTGKTTTIAHIIRALTSQGKSVLLTSYTHTAVDNILLKLEKDNIPILRLGAPAKVHPVVKEFATLAGVPMHSFDEIRSAWHDTPVVATTCLGIGHPIFNERTFDYCIVDEASQITLPICLGPIRMARTFVLVGDHNQLPPLVQNEEAREGGLDVSLFKLLSDTHPDSVVNLEHQYRMCEDIMTLSNNLIYKGRLRCGTEQLRFAKLEVPHMDALRQKHYDASTVLLPDTPRSICTGARPGNCCWLRDLLDPEARVRFVNTDTLQPRCREEAKGNRIVNPAEARIVTQLVESLLVTGVPETEVGVMTHYRSQLSLLRHGLRSRPGIEMHTADRFQGRDKEVIVLSLVRANDACAIGDLLRDWRRINVAFTRAKTKLLVVGSRATLQGSGQDEMVARFVGLMESRNWVYDLPADALDNHFFDDGAGTQLSGGFSGGPVQSPMKSPFKSPVKSPVKSPLKRANGVRSPKKGVRSPGHLASEDQENRQAGPKRVMAGQKVLMKNRPVMRDILNDMMNGGY